MIVLLGSAVAPVGVSQAQRPPEPDYELTLELLDRVERLESEVRHMRGALEMQRHQLDLMRQERAAAPAPAAPPKDAIPVPDRPAGAASPSAPVPPTAGTPRPPTSPEPTANAPPASGQTEQSAFEAALGQLREGRYPEAISGFQGVLSAHPGGKLASDAQYWLGESYYLSRNHEAAKEAFINLGLNHPQSERLPDALLKLGYIYGEEGDTDRAREVLEKLVKVYPNTQAANLAGRRLQSLE
ncbi:MAG: tol-pal system protein YbgF [Candidatus Competibacter sp.]|nr:tol-pal system protein YbgF [Candidatus Competibacter sp.]